MSRSADFTLCTITADDVCVLDDPQAEDRAHRLGQQGCVQVRYLIAPGTIDDAMWPLLGKKLQVVGKALDGHATGSATGKPSPKWFLAAGGAVLYPRCAVSVTTTQVQSHDRTCHSHMHAICSD